MRIHQLDFLRTMAVLLVLGRHIPLRDTYVNSFFQIWYRAGWIGVDLFFVLSGFLVSGLLFQDFKANKQVSLKRFYIRRGLRIYPPFYFLLLVTTLVYIGSHQYTFLLYVAELFYFQNYYPGIWNHTWTLAIEEHFYILIGLLIAFKARTSKQNPFKGFVRLFVLMALLLLFLRVIVSVQKPFDYFTHMFHTHLRIDSLFFGVLLSYLHHFRNEAFSLFVRKYQLIILIASCLCVLPAFFLDVNKSFFMHTYGFTLLYLGFGGILVFFLYALKNSTFENNFVLKQLANIGVYSYSIYLWHMPVMRWVYPHFDHLAVKISVYIIGSIVVGIVLSKLVEIPFLNWRNKKFPSKCKFELK